MRLIMTVRELRKLLRGLPGHLGVVINVGREEDRWTQFAVECGEPQVDEEMKECVLFTEPYMLNNLEQNMAKAGKVWVDYYKEFDEEAMRQHKMRLNAP